MSSNTTSAPTTSAPTTSAPTTSAPTTSAPTTSAPSTSAPTTSAPMPNNSHFPRRPQTPSSDATSSTENDNSDQNEGISFWQIRIAQLILLFLSVMIFMAGGSLVWKGSKQGTEKLSSLVAGVVLVIFGFSSTSYNIMSLLRERQANQNLVSDNNQFRPNY